MEGEKAFIISAIQLGTFQFRDLLCFACTDAHYCNMGRLCQNA